ncbi:MAG: addiction module component, family [Candidatus Brocadiaceae bacterium]|nr:addiction module component, family [Candidatus Brocadiaceae bacterium]
MRPNEIIKEIDNLGLSEKLLLVEDVWDSIARDTGELPMPAWQKPELDKRYKDYKNGDVKRHNWEGVHRELRNKWK